MRVTLALLAGAVVALGTGAAWLVADVADWFGHPMAISSLAGLPVFRDAAGNLAMYEPYLPGPAFTLIGFGVVLVPIALIHAAARWRRRVY